MWWEESDVERLGDEMDWREVNLNPANIVRSSH